MKTDCVGHSQVIDKRTAASNRLIQGHLVSSQSNTAAEVIEMKERICAGFFRTSDINCTFQLLHHKEMHISISAVFSECKQIMYRSCRRKQSDFFCNKGEC